MQFGFLLLPKPLILIQFCKSLFFLKESVFLKENQPNVIHYVYVVYFTTPFLKKVLKESQPIVYHFGHVVSSTTFSSVFLLGVAASLFDSPGARDLGCVTPLPEGPMATPFTLDGPVAGILGTGFCSLFPLNPHISGVWFAFKNPKKSELDQIRCGQKVTMITLLNVVLIFKRCKKSLFANAHFEIFKAPLFSSVYKTIPLEIKKITKYLFHQRQYAHFFFGVGASPPLFTADFRQTTTSDTPPSSLRPPRSHEDTPSPVGRSTHPGSSFGFSKAIDWSFVSAAPPDTTAFSGNQLPSFLPVYCQNFFVVLLIFNPTIPPPRTLFLVGEHRKSEGRSQWQSGHHSSFILGPRRRSPGPQSRPPARPPRRRHPFGALSGQSQEGTRPEGWSGDAGDQPTSVRRRVGVRPFTRSG